MLPHPQNYMECALTLAKLALGYTSPNPAVGAIIVKEGAIVGLGYTQPPGSSHAEVMALQQAGERAEGGIMYVTLEPCGHYGRTPPCAQAIIQAGISEIHLAMVDPNPLVSGSGIEALEKAGIKTHIGECHEKAEEINEAYIKFITTGIPFVTAKYAMSLDGKIASKSGDSQWITCEEARKYVHTLRQNADAIMVGVNTVLVDDPQLTARGGGGRGGKTKVQPLRVIVDGKGRTPLEAQIFREPGNTMLAVVSNTDPTKIKALEDFGAEVVVLPEKAGRVDLKELLITLGKREVVSILVEGGSTLLGSFFDDRLVDKVLAFVAPIIIGGEWAKTPVGGEGSNKIMGALSLKRVKMERFGEDVLICGYVDESR